MTYPDGESIAVDLFWEGCSKDKKEFEYVTRCWIEAGIRFGFRRAMLYTKRKR
jgi:hypothetical protein